MAKRRKRRPDQSPLYTDKIFLPYAIALGQLALAWNGLHEMLCLLFCSVMGGGAANQFLAVWHAVPSDRSQRAMLLAAAKSNYMGAVPVGFISNIKWLHDQALRIEDARNDALHSPLWAYERGPNQTIVMPVIGLGHVRAQRLFEKHLLSEFRWCRDASLTLTEFAYAMDASLSDFSKPWPDIPELPNRGATKPSRRRTGRVKRPARPRPSRV
jgi:hypothetical protein